ncbi:hypothetical protein SLS55_006184 [Diplodia seriata]|uniref:Uncharacterized protein n=1 Tax=Diplodia seriata TaxID=420778 RepID=A0ABR3CDJ5_9PEZI
MAGIGLVLNMHDHKLLPNWPFNISINAFVSALLTVSRTTLMVPLTSCIGQLKWLWIKQERPLADLQFFDEASRGPLGALKLFHRTKGIHLVSLGAIITVFALAIDIFVQQSIIVESVFNVALAQSYGDGISWDQFCNKCISIDDDERIQQINGYMGNNYTEYTNGLSEVSDTLRGAIAPPWNSPLEWNPDAELLHIAFVSLEKSTSLNATECIFEMCVKLYNGSVENNKFHEKELRILNTTSNEPLQEDDSLCLDAKHDAHLSQKNLTFCITQPAFWSNQVLMLNTILGWSLWDTDPKVPVENVTRNSDVLKQLLDSGDIPSSMKNIASSATKAIREAPAQHNGIATKTFKPPGTYIKVRWRWLILPVALQAMTLVFLVVTFCRSRIERLENWKSSSLAVFRSGVLSQGDFGMTKAGRQYEIDDIAGQVKICSRYTGTSYTIEQTNSE